MSGDENRNAAIEAIERLALGPVDLMFLDLNMPEMHGMEVVQFMRAHAPYRAPTLVLMGAEQSGLTPEIAAACDVNVKIPMRGRADSLNLAVATGIMIYAATE